MWGTLNAQKEGFELARFIPTHVGNSSFFLMSLSLFPVHPHACGELQAMVLFRDAVAGSSPRMWGTLDGPCSITCYLRFIPTHVGNSFLTCSLFANYTVHPHACGELKFMGFTKKVDSGSSPRMWGTLYPVAIRIFNHRFIPTHVGNSITNAMSDGTNTVHPHACGELGSAASYNITISGSSPRMWGTRLIFP